MKLLSYIKDNKAIQWAIILILAIYVLGLISPITYQDDWSYAVQQGNIFIQQLNEYLYGWHGRFITHFVVRLATQIPIIADTVHILAVIFFFILSWYTVRYSLAQNTPKEYRDLLLMILYFGLIVFYPRGLWYPMIASAHFMSYNLAVALLLLFLLPYLRLFKGEHRTPSIVLVFFTAVIAGSTHEQVVVTIPTLLLMSLVLYSKKRSIPLWYWIGLLGFFLGYLILFLAPSTMNIKRFEIYGGILEWDFFGQTYNWLELGWKRYFFSLIKVLFLWIPYMFPFALIFIILLWKIVKKIPLLSDELLPVLFLFIMSQAIIVVMMFTPRFTTGPMIMGSIFIILATTTIIGLYLNIYRSKIPSKAIKIVLSTILVITYLFQIPPAVLSRIDYNNFRNTLKQADAKGITELMLETAPLKNHGIQTPFGYIRILHNTPWVRYATVYLGYPHINVKIIEKD